MALKKICSKTGCHKVMNDGVKYCEVHQKKFENNERERYKIYQKKRLLDDEQKKFQEFYNSKAWAGIRDAVIAGLYSIDIYELYTTGRIVAGERVHHIVELNEDWNCRLDVSNLIYLTERNHRAIHYLYSINKESNYKIKKKLFYLLEKFQKDFK